MIIPIIAVIVTYWVIVSLLALRQARKIIQKYRNRASIPPNPKYEGIIRKDFNKWNESQIYLGCFLRFPFKAFLLLHYLCIAVFWIYICRCLNRLPFLKRTQSQIFRVVSSYGRIMMRLAYDFEDSGINMKIETPIVISNHTNWFDTMYFLSTFWPISFLSKEAIRKVPLAGTMTSFAQGIYLSRGSEEARRDVIHKISERVQQFLQKKEEGKLGEVYPLIIFPEGTTSNGYSIISFKNGAFNDLAPITLLSLNYTCQGFDMGMDEVGQGEHVIISLSLQPKLKVKSTHLEAKAGETPDEYAQRARLKLSEMSGFPCRDVGYRDRKAWDEEISDQLKKKV